MAVPSIDPNELHSLSEALKRVSSLLHEHTHELEKAVEGTYAGESGNPRIKLLSYALQINRQADWELSRLSRDMLHLQDQADEASQSQNFMTLVAPPSDQEPTSSGPLERERDALRTSISALTRKRNELETLYDIAKVLNSTLEFDKVLELVMDQVISVVQAERGFMVLLNQATGELEFTIARNKQAKPLQREAFEYGISQSTVNRVVQTRQPVLTSDAQNDAALKEQRSIIENRIRSIMCAPLVVRDKCIGAVYVDSRFTANLFEARHRDLLLAFCHQAAIAIDNARLFADLERTLRKVNEDKQYMDNIFASIANGVLTTDSAGVITAFNRAAGEILQLDHSQALGQPYQQFLRPRSELGLIELLRHASLQHEHGTIVPSAVDCQIPQRGLVNLNFYVSSLRDERGKHIGMALVIDDRTELKRAEARVKEIRRIFGRYVHPNVVQQLISDPKALNLGGETKEISVISADIRGYTRLSERLSPEHMMNLLNDYLELMVKAIWEEEGTLTAFWGDELMAIFNAPLAQPDHPLRAVRAAWKMRLAVLEYQRQRGQEIPVSFGIGVNSGLAIVGNIGSKERLQNYTAIGDTVNVASRLQSNSTDNNIYLNHSTFARVRQYVQVEYVGQLAVKNKTEPLDVMCLMGLKSDT